MRSAWIGAVAALALLGAGCGGEDPEAQLRAAGEQLEEARGRVVALREKVESRAADAEKAKQELGTAREKLREAELALAKIEASIDRSATDDVLFRAVQSRLLEADALEKVAIRATVSKGVVTLSGSVPNAKLRDRAVEIAKQTPGVEEVESRIEVQVAAGKKPGS